MSIEHYENFPVASWLCPPALRPAVVAIYRFARTADDLADEGDAAPELRLADLRAYRGDLLAAVSGAGPGARWPEVFGPLVPLIARHGLAVAHFTALLDAFEQDLTVLRYADRAGLLDYCARSANPIGRLLLGLYGVNDPASLARSDAICSALQLANFWQDLSIDTARGRLYVPLADAARHGVSADALLVRADDASSRALVGELVAWTRRLMQSGAPLVHSVPGRAGWELRLVVQGGLQILRRIESLGYGSLRSRPALGLADVPGMAWRAITMRAPRGRLAGRSA